MSLWLGNFDFEHRLAQPGRTPSARLRRLDAELAAAWLAVAEDGDVIWTPEPIPATFWEAIAALGFPRVSPLADWRQGLTRHELIPWGWTPELLAAAAGTSSRRPPTAEIVRLANSRRWSFDRETEWQIGLPGAACCSSTADVLQAISALPGRNTGWVIKAEFGMSGRERLLGRGSLTDAAANWLRHRLRADGVVFFEPWVERIAEAGIQWEIPAAGQPQLIGIADMLPTSQGQYAGSVFAGGSPIWSTAVEVTQRAAVALQRVGYFGPLGIDAMWYRTTDGESKLRPLQDVNARWTMGRLALGWRRFFPDAEFGYWAHSSGPLAPASGERGPETGSGLASPRVITTSPETVGDEPCRHRTTLVVHPRG